MVSARLLPGLVLFPFVMLLLLLLGMGVATAADPSIWVPKRLGIGYTLDWSKPTSWLLMGYTLGIVVFIIYGATHPAAPGASQIIEVLTGLVSGR